MQGNKFLVALAVPILASASQIFTTPPGASVSDGSVSAMAMFSLVNTNQLQITLTDTLANPTSAGQLLSDLQFSLSGVSNLSLSSMSGPEVSITGGGTAASAGTATSGWVEGAFGSGDMLCVICANTLPQSAAPTELIIGPGPYTNANGSIAGNPAHNPFIADSATFILSGTGITSSTTVSNVVFSFGTQFGSNVTGIASGGGGTIGGGQVPEPTSLLLVAVGCAFLILRLRRRTGMIMING